VDRYLRGSGDTLRFTLYVNGELTDSEEDVTVSIANGAGTAVGASATAAHPSLGVYERYPTAAQMASLDTYTASWTVTLNGEARTFTTQYEVVGGTLFTLAELRDSATPLGDLGRHTTAKILAKKKVVESRFENWCRAAFFPKGHRQTFRGEYSDTLILKYGRVLSIESLTVDGEDVDLDDLDRNDQAGILSGYRFHGDVDIHFTYGYQTVPDDLKEAAMGYCAHLLQPSNREFERTLSITSEIGTTQIAQPNSWRPTGIPWIDSILWAYNDSYPAIA
jgi:hypothetical protein